MNYIKAYLEEIHSGKAVVGKRLRSVYERLVDDIDNPKGYYIFDEGKANRPIEFIERFCRHSKGEWAGKPVKLELFQKAFIAALFGFIDSRTGLRKYREAFFYVARKNGKTTLLSALALYCMIADREAGSEVYSVATKYAQARLCFDECINMVKQSPDLLQVTKKRKNDLYCPLTFSKMQPLAKTSGTLDGLNAHLVIIDELHGIQDRNAYEVMKQSQSARTQPLLIMITTAGTVRESIFDDMYKYACSVADGSIQDETFFPVLYELDSKTEWADPMMWEKANPSLGRIKKLDDMIQKAERAKQSPSDLSGFLCKDMNVISTTKNAFLAWQDIENTERFDIEGFRGSYCVGGVDLSITTDLTSASIVILGKDGRRYVKTMAWLPEANFYQRVNEEKIPYDKWLEQGYLRLCEGTSIVYSDVTQWFLEVVNEWGLTPAWVYYDPYSSRYFVDEMTSQGFNMVKCIQGAKTLSNPLYQLGADLKAKKVVYDNNPMVAWCLSNLGVVTDRNGNIAPIKAQAAKYRIDCAMSLLDAYVGLQDHLIELENAL